jgi:hypothetical protein
MTLSEGEQFEFRNLLDALLEEQLDDAGCARLMHLLAENEEYRSLYVSEMNLHSAMLWDCSDERMPPDQRDEEGILSDLLPAGLGAATRSGSPPVILIDTSSPFQTSPASPSLLRYLTQVGPFSYLVSALIMCVAVFAAWQYKIANHPSPGFAWTPPNLIEAPVSEPLSMPAAAGVAKVTGMANCRWSEEASPESEGSGARKSELTQSAPVAVGRKVALESGVVEITYQTGASVIVEGPAKFEVDSHGGYLSFGRLTGKLDATAADSGSTAAVSNSFVIRTPTAVVTDLGTRFGVEVDAKGHTSTYVFRGAVKVHPTDAADNKRDCILQKRESVQVERTGDAGCVIRRVPMDPSRFIRHVQDPRTPIKVFGTGFVGVKELGADLHWQVVALTGHPDFQPEAANLAGTLPNWLVAGAGQPQWVTTFAVLPDHLPVGGECTFRTTFKLEDVVLETASVRGGFLTNGHVAAIRLNDQMMAVPEHGSEACSVLQGFLLDHGFVEGTNVIEFDVVKTAPEAGRATYSPWVSLCVDLKGAVEEK